MRSVSLLLLALLTPVAWAAPDLPDIRSIPADLETPAMVNDAAPAAGVRVRAVAPGWEQTQVYHALYLPRDWKPDGHWPVIVELPGNGGFHNDLGDECGGRPEGCNLGYGITAGQGAIWVSAPFVNGSGTDLAITWWGDKPSYDPEPTLTYLRAVVAEVCARYGGRADRVILAGFSRGSIAVNRLGLNDDVTAKLWHAFICYSHYDGARTKWPYPGADGASALERLQRLRGRAQFICGEGSNTEETRDYLRGAGAIRDGAEGAFTFVPTGFRNHNDAWALRPSAARDRLRAWFSEVVK